MRPQNEVLIRGHRVHAHSMSLGGIEALQPVLIEVLDTIQLSGSELSIQGVGFCEFTPAVFRHLDPAPPIRKSVEHAVFKFVQEDR